MAADLGTADAIRSSCCLLLSKNIEDRAAAEPPNRIPLARLARWPRAETGASSAWRQNSARLHPAARVRFRERAPAARYYGGWASLRQSSHSDVALCARESWK